VTVLVNAGKVLLNQLTTGNGAGFNVGLNGGKATV